MKVYRNSFYYLWYFHVNQKFLENLKLKNELKILETLHIFQKCGKTMVIICFSKVIVSYLGKEAGLGTYFRNEISITNVTFYKTIFIYITD